MLYTVKTLEGKIDCVNNYMIESMQLLKTCENTSPVDRSVVYDVSLYQDGSAFIVTVEWPWGFAEKRFESYSRALQYYRDESQEAIDFDFSPYDGRA